jgi:3'-5' exoribonuclease
MVYINQFKENDQVQEYYLCSKKQMLKTRAGKTYISVTLQDKTGVADGKVWDLNSGIEEFAVGDYIKIDALIINFQGSMQLNIRRIRKANEGEYDPAEYIPCSEFDIDEMYTELLGYIQEMEQPYLKKLAESLFVKDGGFKKAFKAHTAAKTVHHNYFGGLLEHTLGIIRICKFMADNYPILDRDILYSGALYHDMGKLKELSSFPIIEYTDEGQLIGHIIIGIEWLTSKINLIDGFPETLANLVKHMILAHHGELEYGSPKKPELIEAVVLHYADNMDAKVKSFSAIISNNQEADDWLGFQRIFDTNLRRTRY